MSVQIGQASIDERGKISGGLAGDQTGKELNIRSYYGGWRYVLRCKDTAKAERIALECRKACLNAYIGYDQSQRNTLKTQAIAYGYDLASIRTFCECDCSSLVAVCALCAGIDVYTSANAPTTATMVNAFKNTGLFDVLTDSVYLNSDKYLKAGDILVKTGHTVIVLDGSNANAEAYKLGATYITKVDLYVRDSANGQKLKYDALTVDAKAHAKYDSYGHAILNSNTRVTCKDIKKVNNATWLKIPSGWICAVNDNGKVYVL